jgi:hypothetical protein
MSLSASTISAGIAAMTVSGVTIKDIDEIPEAVMVRDCPVLFPSFDTWMGGANGEPAEGPTTFGTASTRYWIFNRIYRYIFLYAPVGSGRGLRDHFAGMVEKADAVIEALCELDIDGVDVQNVTLGEFGVITDPSANNFYGFTLAITFRERINA